MKTRLYFIAVFFSMAVAAGHAQYFDSTAIVREISELRWDLERERSKSAGPSKRAQQEAERRAWVAPRFGLGGELLNASDIPPQFRAKVAASMGKPVEQVFAKQLAAEKKTQADSTERVRKLEAKIAELEKKLSEQQKTAKKTK